MSDQDKDTLDQGEPSEFMPGDDEFEEGEEAEAEEAQAEEPARAGRRFGFRRGSSEEQAAAQQLGSVRTSHERVRIDDRLSAFYALGIAAILIGILVVSTALSLWPANAAPLPPLNLATYVAPPATPTPTPTPVPTASPTASPTAAPTASPTATVAPSPTK